MRNSLIRMVIGTALTISTAAIGIAPVTASPSPPTKPTKPAKPAKPTPPPKPDKPGPPTEPTPGGDYVRCLADGNSIQYCDVNSGD